MIVPKGDVDKLKAELVSQQPLVAPVQAGQQVGTLRVTLDGKPLGEYPVVALEAVPVGGLLRPRLGYHSAMVQVSGIRT